MTKRKGLPAVFYPRIKPDVPTYFNNFTTKLATYVAKYGIDVAEHSIINSHNAQIAVKRDKQTMDAETAQHSTRIYDEELLAAEIDAKRVINKIVEHSLFIKSDGEDMGFIVVKTPPDPNTSKAAITGITSMPDLIRIDWVKSIFDGVVIYGSYDGQNFLRLDKDNRSPYEDIRKNRTNNVPETRYYKVRFLLKDKEVGMESDVAKTLAEIF